jgi:transposase-like protein
MVSSREAKQVRVAPSSGVTEREIVKRAVKNIGPDATIYHDDYCTYGILDGSFKHESVNHSAGEYVRGDVHTNTIEGEFSVLRPWLQTFRGISKENAYLYCAHYQHLRSNRGLDRVVDRALSMFCLPQSTVDAYQGSELQLGDEPALLPMAASN